ncbi:MAG: hypothetical protein EXR75_03510 [Myxococcales bacterium]|nr:hypothetical protein [Myxococcales bacterium]
MRHYTLLTVVATTLLASLANAQTANPAAVVIANPAAAAIAGPAPVAPDALEFDDRFVLDTGRVPLAKATPTSMSFELHGEAQLRLRAATDLRLEPRIGAAPGVGATLGQNYYLYEWMRLRPVFRYRDTLEVVAELDVPRGIALGQTTTHVSAARDDLAELAFYGLEPRQLYLQYKLPFGLVRAGQQAAHWGAGIVANDGDHPTLFGDTRRGALVERLLFATRPLGQDTPLVVALAGDLVFKDARASLVGDIPEGITPAREFSGLDTEITDPADFRGRDRAFQLVTAARWETKSATVGLYGVYRNQKRHARSLESLAGFKEELAVGVIDFAGKINAKVPGSSAFFFAQWELAYVAGRTSYVRGVELLQQGKEEAIQQYGGAARVGLARVKGTGAQAFGDLVVTFEYGHASGDADPYDGVTRRFTFDQNYNVGLVLFDHVMGWKTARSATLAQDPLVTFRPSPGVEFLPSEGAIFGSSYINPTVVMRPRRWLDLKGGVVIAQTTADFVDPFRAGALGNYDNFDGGTETAHDLGLELDLGADARFKVAPGLTVQAGVEGGVLFPGGAFDTADGTPLSTQYLVNTKLGAQF